MKVTWCTTRRMSNDMCSTTQYALMSGLNNGVFELDVLGPDIPDEDHVIREFSAKAIYKGFEDINITSIAYYSDSSRYSITYKAFSFYLTAQWFFLQE